MKPQVSAKNVPRPIANNVQTKSENAPYVIIGTGCRLTMVPVKQLLMMTIRKIAPSIVEHPTKFVKPATPSTELKLPVHYSFHPTSAKKLPMYLIV